jgi:hypothetical protein
VKGNPQGNAGRAAALLLVMPAIGSGLLLMGKLYINGTGLIWFGLSLILRRVAVQGQHGTAVTASYWCRENQRNHGQKLAGYT